MAKARGLPETFKLSVSQTAIGEKPVELGDYLDEEPSRERAARQPDPAPVPEARHAPEPAPEPPPRPRPQPAALPPEPQRHPPLHVIPRMPAQMPARTRASVPRKQVNMSPQTLGMLDQLLSFVQTYGVQKDLKSSELFHALVLAVYEAREHIDLSRVQPRGKWGSPTAAALPIALKNSFQKAIRDYHDSQARE